MKCEFAHCIHNSDFLCSLELVEINLLGMCEACMIVSLDQGFLAVEKARQLKELERECFGEASK